MSDNWTVIAYHAGQAVGQPPKLNPRHTRFRLRVAPSPIHRWGVFSDEPIPPRRKVIEYTGERLTPEQTAPLFARPLHYLFHLDDYWTIDGASGGSGAEIINHSCQPNLRAWIFKGHILYMSRRPIEPGEELTVDYQFRPSQLREVCGCRSPQCRGSLSLKS